MRESETSGDLIVGFMIGDQSRIGEGSYAN